MLVLTYFNAKRKNKELVIKVLHYIISITS